MAFSATPTCRYHLLERIFDALQAKYDNIINEIDKAIGYTESEDLFQLDETHKYIKWSADLIVENESQICSLQEEVARLELVYKVKNSTRHRPGELRSANLGSMVDTDTWTKVTSESRCHELEAEVKRPNLEVDNATGAIFASHFIQGEFDTFTDM